MRIQGSKSHIDKSWFKKSQGKIYEVAAWGLQKFVVHNFGKR